jgi:hypothetical protein
MRISGLKFSGGIPQFESPAEKSRGEVADRETANTGAIHCGFFENNEENQGLQWRKREGACEEKRGEVGD